MLEKFTYSSMHSYTLKSTMALFNNTPLYPILPLCTFPMPHAPCPMKLQAHPKSNIPGFPTISS